VSSGFDDVIDKWLNGRGRYQCMAVNKESGKQCLFPADYMTADEDPRYQTPDHPHVCGRHIASNWEVEAQKEREHTERVAAMPPPRPYRPVGGEPACWEWEVTDEVKDLLRESEEAARPGQRGMAFAQAVMLFSHGLCAICGNPGGDHVEDHDHRTGMVRGWLCRSCNTREGLNRDPDSVWGKYRQRHPYQMLGIEMPYSGYGWEDGKPIGAEVWPPPEVSEVDQWKNHPFRGVI
jgi:hypothetical protein